MAHWLQRKKNTLLWLALTAVIGGYLTYIQTSAKDKTPLLPGITTHGHYQIEMECSACHVNEKRENVFTSSGVSNAACNQCHGEDLTAFSDSHPVRKFRNPENAIFLEKIDAMSCVACHQEHNQKITQEMGVTIPNDYCAHCHEVTLESLDSHKELSFLSCATAGCHNFHDNMALAPSFLVKHYGERDILEAPVVPETNALQRWLDEGNKEREPVTAENADAPAAKLEIGTALHDWENSAHARAGVNCSDCHDDPKTGTWIEQPGMSFCMTCHETESVDFQKGKHGMRLAHVGLSPMKPSMARQPMHEIAAHAELSCNSCHDPHTVDRQFAAQEACMQCHADSHTLNYTNSKHYALWTAELAGGVKGSGVSCATCHMPRVERNGEIIVNHNQNANLTPNEKMLRNTCMECHGMQFAMDALSDHALIHNNFSGPPTKRHPGMGWAVDTAIAKGNEELAAIRKYLEAAVDENPEGLTPADSTPNRQTNITITQ
ncbi:MAG: ammonia-forming cytochrome c nitrite reductase subunit c552 [Verrucomicrobiota bacterium]